MKSSKVILFSAVVAAAAMTMAIGGTYALFTSHGDTTATVSAGKVSVAVSRSLTAAESSGVSETISDNAVTFANGGTAKITGDQIVLTSLTPGDKLTVHLALSNASNVKIKYRSVVACYGHLFPGLKISLAGSSITNSILRSSWTNVDLGASLDSAAADLVIELPESADDSYQGTTATIRVNFQAVQQNGNVADSKHLSIDDTAKTGTILDAEGLEILSKNVAAGTQYKDYTLSLASDLDMSYANWTPIGSADATTYNFKGTLDGGGHTLSHLLILEPNSNYVGLFRNLMSGSVKNLILSDEYVSGTQSVGGLAGEVFPGAESISNVQSLNSTILGNHWVGGLVGYAYSASVSDCTVSGTTIDCVPNLVSGAYDNGDKAGGLIGANNDYAKVEGNSVKNCTITAYRDVGGLVGMHNPAIRQ
jgi:hypothetical protein